MSQFRPIIVLTVWLMLTVSQLVHGEPPAEKKAARTDFYGDPLPADAVMRLGTLRHRLSWDSHYQILPDAQTALTHTGDEIRWVDTTTGRLIRSCPLPKGFAVCGFSPDGKWALLFDRKTLDLWDIAERQKARTFQAKGQLGMEIYAYFSSDGKVAVTNSGVNGNPGLVRAWGIANGQELWQEGFMGMWDRGLSVLGFLEDGKTLVVLDRKDFRVSLRDRRTGREQRSFPTMERNESRMSALSPDGKTVFMGTAGTAVRAWDLVTGKELSLLDGHKGQARTFAVSQDGKIVLTGGEDSFVQVWDWPAAKLRQKINLPKGRQIGSMSVSADGMKAEIVLWGERALRSFDLATGKEIPPIAESHLGPVDGLAITHEGEIVSAGTDNTIRVWDIHTGKLLRKIRTEHPVGAMKLAVSADGRLAATSDINHGAIPVHDLASGRLVRTITEGQSIAAIAFAPHGNLLAVCGDETKAGAGANKRFLAFFDTDTGRKVRRWEMLFGDPVFSPDGRLLAGTGDEVLFLEVATGQLPSRLPAKNSCSLAYSPDGRTLACGTEQAIEFWELASGKERGRIELPGKFVRLCQYSPDGRWLAASDAVNDDRDIFLCDVCRGQMVHAFTGHDAGVAKLAFTPDGRRLVSASYDTTLLIWDIAGVAQRLPKARANSDGKTLSAAWIDLASADAKVAYRAIAVMIEASRESPDFLRGRIRPAPASDARLIERLVTDLDSELFEKRERATHELEQFGNAAEKPLRRMLKSPPSPEARRRAEKILNNLRGPISDPNLLRALRTLEVLEFIGSEDAKEVLQIIAKGTPEARLTQEAKASLERLQKRVSDTN